MLVSSTKTVLSIDLSIESALNFQAASKRRENTQFY